MQKQNYKIYPSLLDAYNWYASSEKDDADIELINKINRVKFSSDLADKGTLFNNFIDNAIDLHDKHGLSYVDGIAIEIVEKLQGSQKQLYTSTTIEFEGISVYMYGYLDFLKQDRVIDLKTTKTYDLGKYKNYVQQHFYPVSLIDNGCEIKDFEFLVTDFDNVYSELYPVNYNESKAILIEKCKLLIQFIESNREKITDTKIFGIEPIPSKLTIHDGNITVHEIMQ